MEMQPGAVKAADHDGNVGLAELPGEIQRAGELVGLHADQPDHERRRRRVMRWISFFACE